VFTPSIVTFVSFYNYRKPFQINLLNPDPRRTPSTFLDKTAIPIPVFIEVILFIANCVSLRGQHINFYPQVIHMPGFLNKISHFSNFSAKKRAPFSEARPPLFKDQTS